MTTTQIDRGSIIERHSLTIGNWKTETRVYDSGHVDVMLELPGGSYSTLTIDDLSELVAFVERHGQVSVYGEHAAS